MIVGIGYDADLKQAKQVLHESVSADVRILADLKPLIAVLELTESCVNFVVRTSGKSADYGAVKYAFTEAVKLRFEREGISLPFPQMDVHVHKEKVADKDNQELNA